jgi:hypothetical protein
MGRGISLIGCTQGSKKEHDMTFDGRLWLAALALFGAYGGFNSAAQAQTGEPKPIPNYSPAQTKALSEWAASLALQAASWGAPAVVMYNLCWNDAVGPKPKAAPNQIFRMEVISTPGEAEASGYVSPNVNTLYGFGFLDLGPQPVIMSMPDSEGRYYTIETLDYGSSAV